MARNLRLLPGGELRVGLPQQLLRLRLQARDLLRDVHVVGIRQMPQFGDLAFQLRDRFFEIEIVVHEIRFRSFAPMRRRAFMRQGRPRLSFVSQLLLRIQSGSKRPFQGPGL